MASNGGCRHEKQWKPLSHPSQRRIFASLSPLPQIQQLYNVRKRQLKSCMCASEKKRSKKNRNIREITSQGSALTLRPLSPLASLHIPLCILCSRFFFWTELSFPRKITFSKVQGKCLLLGSCGAEVKFWGKPQRKRCKQPSNNPIFTHAGCFNLWKLDEGNMLWLHEATNVGAYQIAWNKTS